MKRLYLYFLWLFFLPVIQGCDTASNVEDPDLNYFIKYYGGDGNQYGVDMLALSDGDFLLLGNYFEDAFSSDIYLLRVDAVGDVVWEKRLGEGRNTIAKDIEPTIDGNFIILADVQQDPANMDFTLIKVAPDGSVLGSGVFGGEANDFSRTVTPLSGGDFIVSGTTELTETFKLVNNPDPDLGDFFNYRFDANLNEYTANDWAPVTPGFGGKLDVAVKTVEIIRPDGPDSNSDPDTLFYNFGYSNINLNNTNTDRKLGLSYFLRSSKGDAVNPFFPGNVDSDNDTRIFYVEEVPAEMSGGYVVIGTSENAQSEGKVFIARLRENLSFDKKENDLTLNTTLAVGGRNIHGVAAAPSMTGEYGYLILGSEVRATGVTGVMNIWLSKIDQSGGVLWSRTFGSEAEDDYAAAVTQLPDGKIVMLGTMGLADNQFKMAFIKMNAGGELLE